MGTTVKVYKRPLLLYINYGQGMVRLRRLKHFVKVMVTCYSPGKLPLRMQTLHKLCFLYESLTCHMSSHHPDLSILIFHHATQRTCYSLPWLWKYSSFARHPCSDNFEKIFFCTLTKTKILKLGEWERGGLAKSDRQGRQANYLMALGS